MNLIDYFAGEIVLLESPLPPDLLASRINAAVKPWSLFWSGIMGESSTKHVRLRYREIPTSNIKPVLSGTIVKTDSGSLLDLRFGASVEVSCLLAIFYAALLWTGTKAFLARPFDLGTILVFCGFFMTPLLMVLFDLRRSDEDLETLTEFLAEHAATRTANAE